MIKQVIFTILTIFLSGIVISYQNCGSSQSSRIKSVRKQKSFDSVNQPEVRNPNQMQLSKKQKVSTSTIIGQIEERIDEVSFCSLGQIQVADGQLQPIDEQAVEAGKCTLEKIPHKQWTVLSYLSNGGEIIAQVLIPSTGIKSPMNVSKATPLTTLQAKIYTLAMEKLIAKIGGDAKFDKIPENIILDGGDIFTGIVDTKILESEGKKEGIVDERIDKVAQHYADERYAFLKGLLDNGFTSNSFKELSRKFSAETVAIGKLMVENYNKDNGNFNALEHKDAIAKEKAKQTLEFEKKLEDAGDQSEIYSHSNASALMADIDKELNEDDFTEEQLNADLSEEESAALSETPTQFISDAISSAAKQIVNENQVVETVDFFFNHANYCYMTECLEIYESLRKEASSLGGSDEMALAKFYDRMLNHWFVEMIRISIEQGDIEAAKELESKMYDAITMRDVTQTASARAAARARLIQPFQHFSLVQSIGLGFLAGLLSKVSTVSGWIGGTKALAVKKAVDTAMKAMSWLKKLLNWLGFVKNLKKSKKKGVEGLFETGKNIYKAFKGGKDLFKTAKGLL